MCRGRVDRLAESNGLLDGQHVSKPLDTRDTNNQLFPTGAAALALRLLDRGGVPPGSGGQPASLPAASAVAEHRRRGGGLPGHAMPLLPSSRRSSASVSWPGWGAVHARLVGDLPATLDAHTLHLSLLQHHGFLVTRAIGDDFWAATTSNARGVPLSVAASHNKPNHHHHRIRSTHQIYN